MLSTRLTGSSTIKVVASKRQTSSRKVSACGLASSRATSSVVAFMRTVIVVAGGSLRTSRSTVIGNR